MRELFGMASPRLTSAQGERWVELSERAALAAVGPRPAEVNEDLERAARDHPEAATAPAYLLWAAENLVRQGRLRQGVDAFDDVVAVAGAAGRLLPDLDIGRVALHHRGQAAARDGAVDVAVASFQRLAEVSPDPAGAWLEGGLVLEEAGRVPAAAELYRMAADTRPPTSSADASAELARRALQRLDEEADRFMPDAGSVARALAGALRSGDGRRVTNLASRTHLAAGPAGGHVGFETAELLDRLREDLPGSAVEVHPTMRGVGGKRYLLATGWRGEWLRGDVAFVLTRSPRGWQWTGVAITEATQPWLTRWQVDERPTTRAQVQALQRLALRAPWPAGQHFTAGGLTQFIAQAAAVAAAGLVGGPILAAGFATSRCGWGPRGFYYNQGSTHDDESAFAIDFTRYRRFVPLDPETGGTPVLATADGVVATACGGRPSGDPSASNTVEVLHPDPDTGAPRFLSRYLHLAGPWLIPVSTGMAVRVGERLGLMDDTGNSVLNHLHFSVHDQDEPFPGAGSGCGGVTRGTSVPPSPLDGVRLGDGDSNTCVRSSNAEMQAVRTAEGHVEMLRVHELGGGFGPDQDHLDGEVVFELDARPGEWFGFQLRRGAAAAQGSGVLATLRAALATDTPVEADYVRAGPTVRRVVHVALAEGAVVEAVAGAVTMLRVHESGTGFGPPQDHLDAEVVCQLDGRTDESFGFQLRPGRHLPAGRMMLETLRSALIRQTPVTLECVRTGPTVRRLYRVLTTR